MAPWPKYRDSITSSPLWQFCQDRHLYGSHSANVDSQKRRYTTTHTDNTHTHTTTHPHTHTHTPTHTHTHAHTHVNTGWHRLLSRSLLCCQTWEFPLNRKVGSIGETSGKEKRSGMAGRVVPQQTGNSEKFVPPSFNLTAVQCHHFHRATGHTQQPYCTHGR